MDNGVYVDGEKLYMFMDETSAPYKEGENPYTDFEDPEFDEYIAQKYNFVFKTEGED
ncbi:MAG: hypothetical protein IJV15_09225 [Lachnospiraceae bacterium]|nr:hypothetical protein [Lachnospiraceae bacterium]